MIGEHFRAFLWLRWRLFANQMTRGGVLSKVLLAILGVGAGIYAVALSIGAFVAGLFLLPQAPPIVLLLVWDGVVISFIFSWCIGLITELQRSEALSLEKFLHLPVSLTGVFALNYLSSLVCMTTLLTVPPIFGLTLGLTIGKGPMLALQLPAGLAFVFMVTALSYQFQGWLASMMTNKRRRRTIIVIATLIFVLIFQAPNLINVVRPWDAADQHRKDDSAKREELGRALKANEITQDEFKKRNAEIQRERAERDKETLQSWQDAGWLANMVLPIGWVAWGSAAAMEGNPLPALLATIGYGLIGFFSLWRAYRTTLRIYTGQFTAGAQNPAAQPQRTAAAPVPVKAADLAFLEKRLLGISEQAAAIALSGFRSLLRAPEVKLLLLSPIIIIVLLGGMLLRGTQVPEPIRPLAVFGGLATILFTFSQLAGNQFGYDRSGFRIFVLSPVPRREILLGKNLAFVPILAGLASPVIIIIAIVMPLRFDQLLAIPFQFAAMFLLYCMVANLLSILAPMPVAVGSLKPLTPKMVPMLLHMVFIFVTPIAMSPVLAPWGIEAGLDALGWSPPIPLALLLMIAECAGVVAFFRIVLTWEGRLLQWREQRILEEVVAKAE